MPCNTIGRNVAFSFSFFFPSLAVVNKCVHSTVYTVCTFNVIIADLEKYAHVSQPLSLSLYTAKQINYLKKCYFQDVFSKHYDDDDKFVCCNIRKLANNETEAERKEMIKWENANARPRNSVSSQRCVIQMIEH